MILLHPVFLAASVLLSMLYYLTAKGWQGWKFVGGMIPLLLVLSLMNPVFNTYGEHVLFRYAGGRPYTLEALCYGAALGAMMVSVLMWFACYNAVMTSDKFLYLFGKMAPSVTLILTMVLRLVPSYKNKVTQLNGARHCIGKGTDTGDKKERMEHSMVLLSTLTSWALEGSVITADSMRSRGYGCGKRTTFSIYRFENRDKVLLAVMILPSIVSVSETALRAVPREYEEASLALGATHIETVFRVSVPAARSGIATAIVLGIGRAIGEAMAIIMVAGNVANRPGLFQSVRFLTTAVASEMAYASGLQRQALFSIGLVLFLFIMLINVLLNLVLKREKED